MVISNSKDLLLEKKENLLIIKFNNPKRKNALTRANYAEITRILNEAALDESISFVAFTGVGEYYTSGNDLVSTLEALKENDNFEALVEKNKNLIVEFIRAFINFPKILIAVVNGPCFGIGATTAALCDVTYCSDNAYFYTPFTKLGLCPEGCSSYTFPKILGTSKATEVLLLDEKLSAQDALRYNFVSKIFNLKDLDTMIWPKLVEQSKLPPGSLLIGKKLIRDQDKNFLEKALTLECDALQERWTSNEFITAAMAFSSRKSKL